MKAFVISYTLILFLHVACLGQSQEHLPPIPQEQDLLIRQVNVVTMTDSLVIPNQDVLIRQGQIGAIVPAQAPQQYPDSIKVIDGTGKFLMPGLIDAHAHIESVFTGELFSDAPVYLAYGVTSLINLRGSPEILSLRDSLNVGATTGWYPAIYTAGPYINEPFFHTPQEVREEVFAQKEAGYDLIKMHGDMSTEAFSTLHQTAQEAGMTVYGHAPRNLDIAVVYQEGHHLAHAEEFMYTAFQPVRTSQWKFFFFLGILCFATLLIITIVTVIVGLIRGKKLGHSLGIKYVRARTLIFYTLFMVLLLMSIPPVNALFYDSLVIRILLMALTAYLTWTLYKNLVGGGQDSIKPLYYLVNLLIVAMLTSMTYLCAQSFKTLDGHVERVAQRVKDAEITVCPNLSAYHYIALHHDDDWLDAVKSRPEMAYINAYSQGWWAHEAQRDRGVKNLIAGGFLRQESLLKTLVKSMSDKGVPLLAGTDTGIPWLIPGLSMHEELQLLVDSGLTPYQALRSATVNVAAFLDASAEIGTVETGKKADMVLLRANPLQDIANTREVLGVISGGRWLSNTLIEQCLEAVKVHNL